MTRPLITSVLSESELKTLRAKSFGDRHKIIQDKLNTRQKAKHMMLRAAEDKERKATHDKIMRDRAARKASPMNFIF